MSTRTDSIPQNELVRREPLPGSRKVYAPGPRGMRVPMREIALKPTRSTRGGTEINPPLRVYDTSGPYTDPEAAIDLHAGLPALRQAWILQRGEYERCPPRPAARPDLALTRPREAIRGRGRVTQMYFARKGIVTPEMEFIAVRENLPSEFVRGRSRPRPGHHPGQHQSPRDPSRWSSAATSWSRSTPTSATRP